MPANKISSVERVVTELELLREWCKISYMAGEVNATPPTVISDIKEFERLGIVISRKAFKRKGKEYKLKLKSVVPAVEDDTYFSYEGNIRILHILVVLDGHRKTGITSKKLAEEVGLNTGAVYRYLNMLVAVKWVKRFDPEFGPKQGKLYKPLISIVMRGD